MLNFLRWPRQSSSADTAKERLQILLQHERGDRSGPDYLPLLQRDILEVVQKYMRVGRDDVDISSSAATTSRPSRSTSRFPAPAPSRSASPDDPGPASGRARARSRRYPADELVASTDRANSGT